MPPRTEEENQRIRDERRLEVLQAAAKVFARKGLMIQLIEARQKAGQVVAGDPVQLAMLFYSCIQGLALSDAFNGPLQPSFPSIEQVMRILEP